MSYLARDTNDYWESWNRGVDSCSRGDDVQSYPKGEGANGGGRWSERPGRRL